MSMRLLPPAVLVVVAAASSSASADEAAERARFHDAEAAKLFNVGEFDKAAEHYKKAYQAKPIPAFLHNIAQCYKRMPSLAHLEKALFYFKSFLNNAPADAPRRKPVLEQMEQLERRIAKLRGASPPDHPTQTTGQAPPATRNVRPAPRAPADRTAPAAAPPPQQQRRVEERRSPPFYTRWWFWTAVSVLAGATTAAIVLTQQPDDLPPVAGTMPPGIVRF